MSSHMVFSTEEIMKHLVDNYAAVNDDIWAHSAVTNQFVPYSNDTTHQAPANGWIDLLQWTESHYLPESTVHEVERQWELNESLHRLIQEAIVNLAADKTLHMQTVLQLQFIHKYKQLYDKEERNLVFVNTDTQQYCAVVVWLKKDSMKKVMVAVSRVEGLVSLSQNVEETMWELMLHTPIDLTVPIESGSLESIDQLLTDIFTGSSVTDTSPYARELQLPEEISQELFHSLMEETHRAMGTVKTNVMC